MGSAFRGGELGPGTRSRRLCQSFRSSFRSILGSSPKGRSTFCCLVDFGWVILHCFMNLPPSWHVHSRSVWTKSQAKLCESKQQRFSGQKGLLPGLEFLMAVRRWLQSIRAIAVARVSSGNLLAPGVAADALFRKGTGPARLIRAMDAMTQPKRSANRLRFKDSLGFQVLETIPSHPGIKQFMFPACRRLRLPIPKKERAERLFWCRQ